jgi:hypothetical protein
VKELARMLRGAERHLDMAVGRMRRDCQYSEAEVYPLSDYQQEDLRESLDKNYEDMLEQQKRLPSDTTDIRKRAEEADGAVRSAAVRARGSGIWEPVVEGEYGVSGVFAGVTCMIGRNGVEEIIRYDLPEDELEEFRKCCESIRNNMKMNDSVLNW